jgi:NTP pyrophosphatase (non-canonical NTP hydrolase)
MNLYEHHLLMLMEECAEVAQRASKQMRFGRDEVQPGQSDPNHKRLRDEILDVLCCIRYLENSGQIERVDPLAVTMHYELKLEKITRMLALSRAQGCLTPGEGSAP